MRKIIFIAIQVFLIAACGDSSVGSNYNHDPETIEKLNMKNQGLHPNDADLRYINDEFVSLFGTHYIGIRWRDERQEEVLEGRRSCSNLGIQTLIIERYFWSTLSYQQKRLFLISGLAVCTESVKEVAKAEVYQNLQPYALIPDTVRTSGYEDVLTRTLLSDGKVVQIYINEMLGFIMRSDVISEVQSVLEL